MAPNVEREAGPARGTVLGRAELGSDMGGGDVPRRDVADEAARQCTVSIHSRAAAAASVA